MWGQPRRLLTVFGAIAIAAVLLLTINQLSSTEATQFRLSAGITLSDSTAGGFPDQITTFAIPTGDSNFAGSGAAAVSFLPGAWCVASHDKDCSTVTGSNVADGNPVPVGAKVGTLTSDVKLALQFAGTGANDTCNKPFEVPFTFFEAVPDKSNGEVDTRTDGVNIFRPLDDEDGTSGLPLHVTKWPSFLSTLLDPVDGSGSNTIFPRARYSADAIVQSTIVILQLLVFDPGDLSAFPGQPWARFLATGTALEITGYPTLTILQDPQQANNQLIADFCTSLVSTTNILGTTLNNNTPCRTCGANDPGITGGQKLHKNAAASSGIGDTGVHLWRQFGQSDRDEDNDGIENAFDTCPYDTNTDGVPTPGAPDPRLFNGADDDGLDGACDPDNNATKDVDDDGDDWANRLDDCPIDANASTQGVLDVGIATPVPDGGPPSDEIGVGCDLDETTADGHYHEVTLIDFACNSGTDDDGDGWCFDKEDHVGTSDASACGVDAMPPDFNDDGAVNVADRGAMVSKILAGGLDVRFDLNADNVLDILDRVAVVASIGFSCTP